MTGQRMDDLTISGIARTSLFLLKYGYGIYVLDDRRSIRQTLHSALFLAIEVTTFLVSVYLATTTIGNCTLHETSLLIIALCNGTQTIWSHAVFLRFRRQLPRMFQTLEEIQRVTMHYDTDGRIERKNAKIRRIITINRAVTVAFVCGFLFYFATDDVYRWNSYMGVLRFTIILIFPLNGVFIELYVIICKVLIISLDNVSVVRASTNNYRRQPHVVLRFHRQICDAVRATDAIFGGMLLVWSAAELTATLFLLRNMNLHLPDPTVNFPTTSILAMSVFLFCVKNLFAGAVNDKIKVSLNELTAAPKEWHSEDVFGYHVQTEDDLKVKLYVRNIYLRPPALTGWNLYTVSSSTIFTAAGNILTYVLVLYRISGAGSATGVPASHQWSPATNLSQETSNVTDR